MVFEWKKEYEIGIKTIDRQHQDFVMILNELYKSFMARKSEEILTFILNQVSRYIEFHFATEERYFSEFGYEGKDEHIKEHDKFRSEINNFKKRFIQESNQEKIAIDLIDNLENWLINHVDDMDKKYIKCFKDNGLE